MERSWEYFYSRMDLSVLVIGLFKINLPENASVSVRDPRVLSIRGEL